MNLKPIIEKHFPFDEFNPGQYEAIERSVKSIMNNKKHTVLSCPTGVGKSVIGITVHNVINELKSKNVTTTILATTKGLQDQYNKDFPELLDLKGKSNYFCHHYIKEGYNSPKCVEKLKSGECSKDVCPYVIARDEWQLHEGHKTTNSSMMIAAKNLVTPEEPLDIMIIDECHEIDKVIINQSKMIFKLADYPESGNYYTDFRNTYAQMLNILKETYPKKGAFRLIEQLSDVHHDTLKQFMADMQRTVKQVEEGIKLSPDEYKFVIIKNELNDLLEKLEYFFDAIWQGLEWVMDVDVDDEGVWTLVFTPIKSSGALSRLKLLNKADNYLHMSATIGGIDVYCENLGLDKKDVEYIDIDNPIDVARRRVILINMLKVNRFTNISSILNSIKPIIEHEEGNGIIHTVSFKLANDIYYAMPHNIRKRMVVSNNRKEILELLASSNNTIILSPSVETGYDFKHDLARWQIIAKVPYLNLGDNYTKTRMEISGDWYTREAVLRIVQACGRIVRGLDDYGTTYITDENILRLITYHTEMWPEWWIEALDMVE